MNRKPILLLLSATGLLITYSCLAGSNAKYCIESASNAAGYYLSDTQGLYDEGKDDAIIPNSVSSLDSFTFASDDSSTKRGLVYTKFGRDSSGNYIATAYLGKQCGAASNSKLFCNLKKSGSNWTDTSTAPPVPVPGFYIDCQVCSGIKLNASGTEVAAAAATGLTDNELRSVSNALNAAIDNALYHGVNMTLTSSAWPTSPCNTVITS